MTLELIEVLGRAVMVGVAASITVGPVAVLCIQRTLSKSRQSGLVSGLGVAVADTIMAIVAYFFYAMLQSQIEEYNMLLRVVGGIFVVAVGVYIYLQNPVVQIRKNRSGKGSMWNDFVSIFGLTLANFIMVIPYILAFFAVFKVAGSGDEMQSVGGMIRGVVVMSGFFVGSAAWWSGLAFVVGLFRGNFRPRHMVTINHTAGLIIGGLGAYTIISTFLNLF
ncbi:MAG: LysE family transporter [Rikenellaceae bacterium]